MAPLKQIPYSRQVIDDADIDAVADVLRGEFITQGPAVPRFERLVADYCDSRHALAVSNGTAALHLACLALRIGPGDLVWTSPISFVASANCARYCGADVDFVDIEPETINFSVTALEAKLIEAKRSGRMPKAIIPVHFAGASCDMAPIARLARENGIAIIEDASHALGAGYRGKRVGSSEFCDITVLSFHPVKMITTGEGGMLMTQSDEIRDRLELLRSHGITRNPAWLEQKDVGGWYYEQHALGFNYRMTDIQAALGASQMRRLDEFLGERRRIARRYRQLLAPLPVALQRDDETSPSSHHLFVVQLALESIRRSRRVVYDGLHGAGIRANVHYIPIHLQPYYRALGFRSGQFPNAERYYERALSLPIFPGLSDAEQDHVVSTLSQLSSQA